MSINAGGEGRQIAARRTSVELRVMAVVEDRMQIWCHIRPLFSEKCTRTNNVGLPWRL
jgi:hypothetical protein